MEASAVDMQRLAQLMPAGVKRGADARTIVIANVSGLNITAGQVQVTMDGEPVWVPAAPFVYGEGARVRIRRNPTSGRAEYCEGPIDIAPMIVTGKVTAVAAGALTVTVLGSSVVLNAFAAGTYSVNDDVWVVRHTSGFGAPAFVLGVAGSAREAADPGSGSSNPGKLVSRQATFGPIDTGSYRPSEGRWDTWNTNRYGGRSTLWQGNAYGSGPMIGWAGYGTRVMGLNAQEIDLITVRVIRADTSVSTGRAAELQGTGSGTRPGGAPSGGGPTVTTSPLTPGRGQTVTIPSATYNSWRTGAIRGLILVGSDYGGFYGLARGDAMVLTVQYKVRV